MSMLLEMLSRWPRYLSQGPAILMWSVVHLPLTLIRMCAPCKMPGCDKPRSAAQQEMRAQQVLPKKALELAAAVLQEEVC